MGDSVSFGSSLDGFDDSNFAGALSAKKVNTKRIEGVLSDMRDQASSIIGHLVSVGEERREMIELSRKKIKLREESLELNTQKMKLLVQVDLAKALGDTEELKRLLAEAKAID